MTLVKYTLRAVGITLLLCMSLQLNAQQEMNDLRKMSEAYLKARTFSMNMEFKAYQKAVDQKELFVHKGIAKKIPGCYYTSLMGKTMLVNKDIALVIDDERKFILCKSPFKEHKNGQVPVDTAAYTGKLRYLWKNDKQRKIEITEIPSSEYEKIELTVNAKSFVLEEVVYYYKRKSMEKELAFEKVHIKYTNISLDGSIPYSSFSEQSYVTYGKTGITPAPKYSGYKIIDQRKLTK